MKALPLLGHAKKISGISILVIAALAATSCISRSEKEFKAQHGFKRSDYFGKKNTKFVPRQNLKQDNYQEGDTSPSGFATK